MILEAFRTATLYRITMILLILSAFSTVETGVNVNCINGYTGFDFYNHTSVLETNIYNYGIGFYLRYPFNSLKVYPKLWFMHTSRNYLNWAMSDRDFDENGDLWLYTLSDVSTIYNGGGFSFNLPIRIFFINTGINMDNIKATAYGIKFIKWDLDPTLEGEILYGDYPVWKYSVSYMNCFVGLGTNFNIGKLYFEGEFKYPLYITVSDEDKHLLRRLRFIGNYSEFMPKISQIMNWMIKVGYDINDNWRMEFGYRKFRAYVKGSQWCVWWGEHPQDVYGDISRLFMGVSYRR